MAAAKEILLQADAGVFDARDDAVRANADEGDDRGPVPFHLRFESDEDPPRITGLPSVEGSRGLIMIADPYSFPADAFLEVLWREETPLAHIAAEVRDEPGDVINQRFANLLSPLVPGALRKLRRRVC